MKIFDFQNNITEVLDIETLKLTHKENDVYGNPLRGMYHYEVIERVFDICSRSGFDCELEEVFAAQNRSKQNPGVSILPQVEAVHGTNAVEAHILRRVYSTIRIKDMDNSEMTTNVIIAYHQDGTQVAFGPCVRICHNQCILGAERTVSNYGKSGVSNEEVFASVQNWMDNFFEYREADIRILARMKQIDCCQEDVFRLIGLLTSLRVSKDSSRRELSGRVKQYPLTQAQITQFTEDYLLKLLEQPVMSLWDVYNIATELYKPLRTEIPNLIPQNVALMGLLKNRYELT